LTRLERQDTLSHFDEANPQSQAMKIGIRAAEPCFLLLLALAAVLVQGYHFGFEDQAIWLPAVRKILDPKLYPYDSIFFLTQTQYSFFPQLVAFSAKFTHVPLDVAVFVWHVVTIFLVLFGCRELARLCFVKPQTQWAAVATIWAALLLPVAGAHLNLMDRYLHPRDLATGALLIAFVAVLRRRLTALPWIAFAAIVHPTMAIFGAFHLAIQAPEKPRKSWLLILVIAAALVLILIVMSLKPVSNTAWHEVLATRPYLFPLKWPFYAWTCTVAVLAALGWFGRLARRRQLPLVERISRRVVVAGIIGIVGSILISTIPAFERLIPTEPMRTLHFVYLMLVFLGGGLMGECVLHNHWRRWLLFLSPIVVVFFLLNRWAYSASPYIEWPGRVPKNDWVEAFDWIRRETPRSALFALDPVYMTRPGEDHHGFRPFAERSMLADWVKDRSVAALDPNLAYEWRDEEEELANWSHFGLEDLRRLKRERKVDWVVLERGHNLLTQAIAGLSCPYANEAVIVCNIP
jgi:hypothetical protein